MKTAVFFLSASCGGAERMTITIAKLLDPSEYDVRFVVIGREIGEIRDFIPNDRSMSLVRIRNIYDFTTLRVYRYLKGVVPQFVFCSLHYLNPRVIVAARMLGGCKVIVQLNCAVNRLQGINRYLTKMTYPSAQTVISQTERMQEDLERAFPNLRGEVKTIPNLIDKAAITNKLKDASNPYASIEGKKFVWVGRYDRVKGVDTLIKAFIEHADKDLKARLFLVGKIDEQNKYYQELRTLIDGSGVGERISMVGFQSNPYKWIKNADCFILSSQSEGSPNALFEALYLGVPSVATRCTPNIDRIITDGINGYKVDVGDYMAMAECMKHASQIKSIPTLQSNNSEDVFRKLFESSMYNMDKQKNVKALSGELGGAVLVNTLYWGRRCAA